MSFGPSNISRSRGFRLAAGSETIRFGKLNIIESVLIETFETLELESIQYQCPQVFVIRLTMM
jgi:hypothetical protein